MDKQFESLILLSQNLIKSWRNQFSKEAMNNAIKYIGRVLVGWQRGCEKRFEKRSTKQS